MSGELRMLIDGELVETKSGWRFDNVVGVVAAIVPWNFPFEVAVSKLVPALAAGNTVIPKAGAQTLKRLFLELGGKSAHVVLDDADFDRCLAASAIAACRHRGQPLTGRETRRR